MLDLLCGQLYMYCTLDTYGLTAGFCLLDIYIFVLFWVNFALDCLDVFVNLFVNKLAAKTFHIHSKPN